MVLVDERSPVAPAASHGRGTGHVLRHGADIPVNAPPIGGGQQGRHRLGLIRHVIRACHVAAFAGKAREERQCVLDVQLVPLLQYGVGHVDVARVEGLERVDRVGVGSQRTRLHLQVRPATRGHVADTASRDAATPAAAGMEGRGQLVMAVVALGNLCDRIGILEVVLDEGTAAQIDGPRDRV